MTKLYLHDGASPLLYNISKELENIKQAVEDFDKWEKDETMRNRSRNEFSDAFSEYKKAIDALEKFVKEELKQIKKNPTHMQGLDEWDKFSTKKFKLFYSEIVDKNNAFFDRIEKGSKTYRVLLTFNIVDEKPDAKIHWVRKYMRVIESIIKELDELQ